MADKFKPGDVVTMKSGGPRMTVVAYDKNMGDGMYKCRWYEGKEIRENNFSEAELEIAGSELR